MGQPVKLSDALILDARLTGELAERSIAGQIEHWAGLGRAIETFLRVGEVLTLKQRGTVRPLAECLTEIETAEGQARLKEAMRSGPYPRYEAAAGKPGWLLRTEENGTQTIGRFVQRRFVAYSDGV